LGAAARERVAELARSAARERADAKNATTAAATAETAAAAATADVAGLPPPHQTAAVVPTARA